MLRIVMKKDWKQIQSDCTLSCHRQQRGRRSVKMLLFEQSWGEADRSSEAAVHLHRWTLLSSVCTNIEIDIFKIYCAFWESACINCIYKPCLNVADKNGWMKLNMSLGSSKWNRCFTYVIPSHNTKSFPTVCVLQWATTNYTFIGPPLRLTTLCSWWQSLTLPIYLLWMIFVRSCSSTPCICSAIFLSTRARCACWTASLRLHRVGTIFRKVESSGSDCIPLHP